MRGFGANYVTDERGSEERSSELTSEFLGFESEGGRDVDQRFVCKDSSGGGWSFNHQAKHYIISIRICN
jgi:hypothetical protein